MKQFDKKMWCKWSICKNFSYICIKRKNYVKTFSYYCDI